MIVEPNTKTDFYYVDGDYIEYLKQTEEKAEVLPAFPMYTIGIRKS